MKTDTYVIFGGPKYTYGVFNLVKRNIRTLSSTGSLVEIEDRYFVRLKSSNDLLPVLVYGVDEYEADRRYANFRHDYQADGLVYQQIKA